MRKQSAIIGTGVFLLIAPGTVVGLIPWWLTRWRPQPPLFGTPLSRAAGAGLVLVGAAALIDCFVRFAVTGLGTPAPPFPTRRLVISGLYRWVRNPMYVAVIAVIFGQALLLASLMLALYAAAVWLAMHLFVVVYEEPALRASFADDYPAYAAAVRRWRPRITPWPGGAADVRAPTASLRPPGSCRTGRGRS